MDQHDANNNASVSNFGGLISIASGSLHVAQILLLLSVLAFVVEFFADGEPQQYLGPTIIVEVDF